MDIGIELLQKVTESFQKAYNEDVSIKVLEKRLKANKAHYEDAARYSERVGELLAEAYSKVVTSEALPGGVMTWEIAQEVIQKPLIENYRRAATASVDYIAAENKRRGIGLKAQKPRPDFERLDGIKRKLVDAEKFDDVAFMLDRPVVNFTRAVLDDAVEVNADFQAKAGLDVKIVRTTTGRETCDWCKRLAGTYDYEDVRHGHDVWKRHLDCDCKIEHVSVKGREVVQNYRKSVTARENSEKIKERKAIEPPDDRAPEKIETRKATVGVVAEALTKKAKSRFEVLHDGAYSVDDIIESLNKTEVGQWAVRSIAQSNVRICMTKGEYETGCRGDQNGNLIKIFQNNIKSMLVLDQTIIHEMAHYKLNIGGCQHAEAVCFAFEKMHKENRAWLTQEEWDKMRRLAIDNYPEYQWERGGYGDYSRLDFVRKEN